MILSVSRRTDIPNYYSEWFFKRIREGFACVRNPFNAHQISRIDLSPDVVDCIVFWTKNPLNMLDKLDEVKEYPFYFQFTLSGYGQDIECGLPDKKQIIIPVFQSLSNKIGKERVIWRYDPILLNNKYTSDYHLQAFREIANGLSGYTERVVISFVDLYAKTQRNMKGLSVQEMTDADIVYLAEGMAQSALKNDMIIESCAEKIDLQAFGIQQGSCIDKKLIENLLGCELTGSKDKNQRPECGCMESIDIGAYNTCRNGCRYCYANYNDTRVNGNVKMYDPESPLLCGQISPDDKVTEREVKSLHRISDLD